MRYFVLSDDGQKYGPADVATLNQWIAENRLLPHQMLEEEASGTRLAARSVAGLNFPVTANPGQPAQPGGPAYSGYYRDPQGQAGHDGSRDYTPALVLFIVGLLPCLCFPYISIVLGAIGTFYGNRAKQNGHPQGGLVFGLNLALLIVAIVWLIAAFAMRGWAEEFTRQSGGLQR